VYSGKNTDPIDIAVEEILIRRVRVAYEYIILRFELQKLQKSTLI